MILEHALISVAAGQESAFEAAYQEARAQLEANPGFRSVALRRGIDDPSRYLLLVEWETLENHVVDFRESERFTAWRSLIGPFFAEPPAVDHYAGPPI